MNISEEDFDGGKYLIFQGEMTIQNAAFCKDAISRALSAATKLRISLSHVCEIDSAGLQLILLCINAMQGDQDDIFFSDISECVNEMMTFCGFSSLPGNPPVQQVAY